MKRIHTRELVIFGLLAAILFVAKFALSGLPNVEPISLLLIAYTVSYGKKALYILYTWVLFEILFYGLSQWSLSYLYVWLVLWAIVMFLRKNTSSLVWAVVSGFYGLLFGFLCSFSWAALYGINAGIAYWISGIPFDISHAVGNFVLTFLLFVPLHKVLEKVKALPHS